MPLPRLTEIGDTFTGTPRAITFSGEEKDTVRFLFEGFEDHETLVAPRITMDARFMDLGFYDPPSPNARASEIDGVVRYDEAIGVPLVFAVIASQRGRKGWSVKKYVKPAPPPAPAPKAPEAKPEAAVPLRKAMDAPGVGGNVRPTNQPNVATSRAPEKTPEAKRQDIRDAVLRELAFVLDKPLALAKKKKVALDVGGLLNFVLIEEAKRGCL